MIDHKSVAVESAEFFEHTISRFVVYWVIRLDVKLGSAESLGVNVSSLCWFDSSRGWLSPEEIVVGVETDELFVHNILS